MSIASRIENMETNVSKAYDSIEGLGVDITEVDKNLENLSVKIDEVYENLPKVEGEGTSITLEDTAKGRLKNVLNPSELSQETTTGANLQKFTPRSSTSSTYGYTYNCDDKGQVTLTGNISGSVGLSYNLTADYMSLSAGTYTMKVIGNITNVVFYRVYNNATHTGTLDTNQEYTFTLSSDVSDFHIMIQLGSYTYNADFYITLASGTTATTERYTGGIPQPNPSYPSDIHVISGDNSIRVENANLIDFENYMENVFASNKRTKLDDGGWEISHTDTKYTLFEGFLQAPLTLSFLARNNSSSSSASSDKTFTFYVYYDDGTSGNITFSMTNSYNLMTKNINKNIIKIQNSYTRTTPLTIIKNVMLNYGTTALDYVPHQEQTKPLNLPVENLFDKANATYKSNYYKNDSGEETGTGVSGYTTSYIAVKPNTNYTIQGSLVAPSATNAIYFYDSSKNWISRIKNLAPSDYPYTFTTPNNCYYIQFQYTISAYDADTIQIEEGSKANTYTPFGTTPIEYCKKGNYGDNFFKAIDGDSIYDTLDSTTKGTLVSGKWYIQKNTLKKILDSSVTWYGGNSGTTSPTYRYMFATIPKNPTSYSNVLCNNFQTGMVYDMTTTQDILGISNNDTNNLRVMISDALLDNPTSSSQALTKWTSWLSSHETIVYYPLGTPTYTLLNDTLQTQLDDIYYTMLSYQGQTNISQVNNDLPFVITSKALRDLNTIINTNASSLQSIGTLNLTRPTNTTLEETPLEVENTTEEIDENTPILQNLENAL